MAFGVTLKSPMSKPERISRSLGIFAGQITISSYATTLVECTALTRYFRPITNTDATAALFPKGIVSCVPSAISESGFAFRWDATTGAFRVYYPTNVASHTTNIVVDSDVSSGIGGALWDSGGGALLHVTSGVGNIPVSVAATEAIGSEANANDAVGTIDFVAIGFI